MNPVRSLRQQAGVSQSVLAERAGTSQPTVAAYESGRKSPTLSTLERLAGALGFEVNVEYRPALTREDRRSLFLHRAIAERLEADPEPVLGSAQATLARMKEKHPGAAPLLRRWEALLDRPVDEIVSVLHDPSPEARELRYVTPFAGVLSARERAAVYKAFAREERESREA